MKRKKFHDMKTLKSTAGLSFFLLFVGLLTSCKQDATDSLDMNADVHLLSFHVDNVAGTVDNEKGTITVMVPAGTNLSAIAPTIELPPNATVKPAAGEPRDFSYSSTSPVVYRVYNGNVYTDYRVTIREIKAEITAFRIGDRTGIINQAESTILVYVPEGTDVTQLRPMIDYTSGAEISPELGSPVDFTTPVTYTLSYLGQTFNYTVTVVLGDEPKQSLLIFNGENVSPRWGDLGTTVQNQTNNPKTDGINPSPLCVSILRNATTGEGWHGGALWNDNKVNINPVAYNRFSIMVLKDVAGDVQIEIQSDGEANKDWLRARYAEDHLGEWQELIFEVPAERTAIINNILVMPHEHPNGQPVPFQTQRMYWDELKALSKE